MEVGNSFLLGVIVTSEYDIIAPQVFREPPQAREFPSWGAGVWPCLRLESKESQFWIQSLFLERACPIHQSRAVVSGNKTAFPVFTEAVP